MPADLSRLQLADYALLGVGVLLILAAAGVVTARGRWRDVWALPPPPANQLEPVDVLIAIMFIVLLPGLMAQILQLMAPATAIPRGPASQPAAPTALDVWAQTVSHLIAVIALTALGRARFEGGLEGWGLAIRGMGRRFVQASIICLAVFPVCYGVLELSSAVFRLIGMEAPTHGSIVALRDPATRVDVRVLTIVNAFVLAAIVEELVFRGVLQTAFARWGIGRWAAILSSSVLFGMIHYPYVDTIVPLAAFGIILGYVYAKSGSLTLVILIHAIFNGKTLLWLELGAK